MKKVILAIFLVSPFALAKNTTNGAGISTDHKFNDTSVRGRYHTSGEAIATVEDEKVLKDLLTVRKNFKDRVKKSLLEQ